MEWLYLITKFIVGGVIIVGITFLTHYIDPKYGGILASAPIITTLAVIFTKYETSTVTTQNFVYATFYFTVSSLVFLIVLYFSLKKFNTLNSLFISYLIWLFAVLIINKFMH